MPRYCFDTSGLSNPHQQMPEDIHDSMWASIRNFISDGNVAVTKEIFDEMIHIDGGLGEFVETVKESVLYEVGTDHWDWRAYIDTVTRMQTQYRQFISEFNGGSPRTVCLNDISIIALAKTLRLPVMSMEVRVRGDSPSKRRIPDICDYEEIEHLTFSEFLRREGLRF